ncbi:MAG: conjugative transposon protein TraM [Bacteroidota bacterium]
MSNKLIQKIKDKPIQSAVGLMAGLIVFAITMIVLQANESGEPDFDDFDFEQDEKLNFRDLMDEDENKGDFLFGDEEEPKYATETDRFLDSVKNAKRIDSLRSINTTQSRYANEDEEANIKMQLEIARMDSLNRLAESRARRTAPREKKKTLTYEEKLLQSKREMLEASQSSTGNNSSNNDFKVPVSFVASFYRDQWVLPGDRARLILEEDLTYKGETFPRGTFIFGEVSISRSRILLKVTNVAGARMDITAYDINDRNEGVYNQRAGELWREYQNNTTDELGNDLAQEVGQEIGGRAVGTVARGITNFFSQKKLRDEDKMLLVNNDKIFFSSN